MTPAQLQARLAAAAQEFTPATELMRAVTRVTRVKVQGQIRRKAYDTGAGHDSTVERVTADRGYVEVMKDYMFYQDQGTRYMRGKHFMAGGLEDAMPDIEQELRLWGDMVLGRVAGR